MDDSFDPSDLSVVAGALRSYEQRCEEILTLLDDKRSLFPTEREEARRLYESLKNDLKAAAKHGMLSKRRERQSRTEECFYEPAVRQAAIALRPATNTNPLTSGWFHAVSDAESELSYWLHSIDGLTGSEA